MNELVVQGRCLVATEGRQWMFIYDKMPRSVRLRLQSSDHNICAACLEGEYHDLRHFRCENDEFIWHEALDRIEAKVKRSFH